MPEAPGPTDLDPTVEIGAAGESFEVEAYREFLETTSSGGRSALVTVVSAGGSVPRGIGAVMAVRPDGSIVGTIGGGGLEHAAIRYAIDALEDGRPRRLRFDFSEGKGRNIDMACSGTAEVFIQPSVPGARLFIFGGGHIARALAPMALSASFSVTVLDDREGFPDPSLFPAGVGLVSAKYSGFFERSPFDADRSYVVIVTHGHDRDTEVLDACLELPTRYVGMIGSRAKVSRVFKVVGRNEARRALLERVHAPIGLDLGGRSPGEIAVSILAEIVAVRYGRDGVGHMARPPRQ